MNKLLLTKANVCEIAYNYNDVNNGRFMQGIKSSASYRLRIREICYRSCKVVSNNRP